MRLHCYRCYCELHVPSSSPPPASSSTLTNHIPHTRTCTRVRTTIRTTICIASFRFTRSFNVVGAYGFYCEPHSWYMTGTIYVRDVGAQLPVRLSDDDVHANAIDDDGPVDQVSGMHQTAVLCTAVPCSTVQNTVLCGE